VGDRFAPAGAALTHLKVNPPTLKLINPMDSFQIMWMKLPILAAVFLSHPGFCIRFGFYRSRIIQAGTPVGVPFVVSSAGLFIVGVSLPISLRSAMASNPAGLGIGKGVDPSINITEYYDLFVDVMLGVGIIFEIPVLLFLLTLIRWPAPRFSVRHSRYAILIIVILAAVITPTGDVFNLALFATPMIVCSISHLRQLYSGIEPRGQALSMGHLLQMAGYCDCVGSVDYLAGSTVLWLSFVPGWPIFVR